MANEKNTAQENVSRKSGTGEKSLIKRLTPYLTFAVLLLTLIGYLADLPQKVEDFIRAIIHPNPTPAVVTDYHFAGHVYFAGTKVPVPGATVIVKKDKTTMGALGTRHTDKNGHFDVALKGQQPDQVWVIVRKDGWTGFNDRADVGTNARIPFRKKP